MQRKYLYAAGVVSVLAAAAALWHINRGHANDGDPIVGKMATTALPISQVVLFNSGVGYIQREGEVTGDGRVDLTFPTSDVNDLLKSLILQDGGGGKIGVISYDSQDPVDKILRSFALDLNSNPTFGQILNQARGEKIEVLRQEKPGANPYKVTGTIIGMEVHNQPAGKDSVVEVEQLNLLTAEGMLSIPLPQVLSVKFMNQTLDNEFRRALQVLAGSHDVQKKTVALHFNGNGKRGVKVGYVVEKPIWKTTYRLVLEPAGKLFIQGWAIVENTSDDDWNNIRMVLVSGKPISYRMDLYDPLYIPRPLVEPELFASLRPPVYGGSMAGEPKAPMDAPPPAAGPGLPGFSGAPATNGGNGRVQGKDGKGGGGYLGGYAGGGLGNYTNPTTGNNLTTQGLSSTNNVDANGVAASNSYQQKLNYDDYINRRKEAQKARQEAQVKGASIAGLNYKEGIQSVASAEDVGDYYQYVIDQKITLARQKSAMLPILNQTIDGAKVSIFNEGVHTKFPLLGLRLKNTSGKPLTQGPITVYDDGAYAGDTRVLDLQPNEERLLSYAIDQSTEVKTEVKTHPGPDMTFNIGGDNLTAGYTMRQTKTYTVKNRSTHERLVIIEHPIRADWKLVDPKKPADKSRDVYRFQVIVPAGATVKQEVVEDQHRTDPVALTRQPDIAPFYAVFEGIEIKPEITISKQKLLSLKIVKGVLQAELQQHESKTYFLQNNSERDHTFTVDHVIRKEWKRLSADDKHQTGPALYRFKVDVGSKKTGQHEVVEERVHVDPSKVLGKIDEDVLREYLANPAPTAQVKQALQQVLDMSAKLRATKAELAEQQAAMKVLTEDQARVRENLKIVPQTSDVYKDFLKKFVAQEGQIDELQRAIRTSDAQVQKLQKEYDTFVTALTVQ
jgi:hypothetical protein